MNENEVSANLNMLIKSFDRAYIKPAMEDACALVANSAKRKAPKDTGALRRSIEFEVSDDGLEGVIYSNLEYAPYVEFGTGIYATVGVGRQTPWFYPTYKDGKFVCYLTNGQRPQPYLEPALNNNLGRIRKCFEGLL